MLTILYISYNFGHILLYYKYSLYIYIYIIIIIIIRKRPKSRHCGVSARQCQGKGEEGKISKEREEKKRVETQNVKHPTPTRATDALIGEEKQN